MSFLKTYKICVNLTSGYYSTDGGKTFVQIGSSSIKYEAKGSTSASVYVLENTTFNTNGTDLGYLGGNLSITGTTNSTSPYIVGTSDVSVSKS
jgi:hypothetical protein